MDWKRPNRPRAHRRTTSHTTLQDEPNAISASSPETPYAPTVSPNVLPTKVVISQGLARDGLSQFFQHGIRASSWLVFDISEMVRIAYIGTSISNLTHLINLEQPSTPFLHLPHPPIHSPLPWKPEADIGGPRGNVDIIRDLSSFPAKVVRDEMVDAFFEKINPYFPVIDECQFRSQYADPDNPPALLLLQAVLLAGAHVCNHPKVVQSRSVVKTVLFRRAKTLFDMRHENDRLHLIQSALLFTWHLENADTASANGYYWAGVACRIAFGLGIHRDLSSRKPTMMPTNDRRIYRRVWWTLFQVEIQTALEHGRPSMIHLDEIDQASLELDDFKEDGFLNTKLRFDYASRNIDLCYLVLEILRLNRPGVNRQQIQLNLASLDSRLASWMVTIPSSEEFWVLQLHLHYHTILLHLHRQFVDSGASQSSEICSGAASAITSILETMVTMERISQCYSTSVIALTAAAIQISREIKLAIEKSSTLLALNSQAHLERLFRPARELAIYWPNAEAVLKLFQSLFERFRTLTIEHLGDQSTSQDFSDTNLNAIDWQDILLYPMQPQYVNEEDWMNVSPDLGMGF